MPDLAAFPCRRACSWRPTDRLLTERRVFACDGCGSEWARGEGWTPAQHDGTVPPQVAAELRAAGPVTTGGSAAGAGNGGTCTTSGS